MITPNADLPNQSKIVICGGGAQGAAIAYKLALKGISIHCHFEYSSWVYVWYFEYLFLGLGHDVVLIDQGALGGGTTWHSSGLISLMKPSIVETKLTKLSKELYLELQYKHGYYTGWKEVGSLYVAQTEDRMSYYKRLKSESVARDVECEIVTPTDCKNLCKGIIH